MTEDEWFAATEPDDLLYTTGWRRHRSRLEAPPDETCHPLVSGERKLRLYACACFRWSFPSLVYAADRAALDATERYADGLVTDDELLEVSRRCGATAWYVTRQPSLDAARSAIGGKPVRVDHPAGQQRFLSNADRCRLLRCLFGNPFRPVTLDPAWRAETVVALAGGIYAQHAFDRMPILADALQEAGCENEDVLSHCRGDSPHARGCWVVDQILGKK